MNVRFATDLAAAAARTLALSAFLLPLGCFGGSGADWEPYEEALCEDGRDDDSDGDIDCADSDCRTHEACIEVCDDDIDNDGDGRVDCADSQCSDELQCAELCYDGIDNDADGNTDCDDRDCRGNSACAEQCRDGIDNDRDGDVDCDDSDCASDPPCVELCDNSFDDDLDGLVDCDDPDCAEARACPELCENGIDDDADGDVDCDDLECGCGPEDRERTCSDGRDNDQNGATDCDDEACAEMVVCNCDGVVVGGICKMEEWSGTFEGPISYVSATTLAVDDDGVHGFDFTGDGEPNNAYVSLGFTFGGEAFEFDPEFASRIENGRAPLLFGWEPGPDAGIWLYKATNDVDGAGRGGPDQGSADRSRGWGVFRVWVDQLNEYGPLDQFNVDAGDGWYSAGGSDVRLVLPMPGSRGAMEVTLRDSRVRANLVETDDGTRSVDGERVLGGEVRERGGIEFVGLIHIDDLADDTEDAMLGCNCAVDPARPIVGTGVREDQLAIECLQPPVGCDDTVFCGDLGGMCSMLGGLRTILGPDIDSDGDGLLDSISVGLWMSAAPARLADPPVTTQTRD